MNTLEQSQTQRKFRRQTQLNLILGALVVVIVLSRKLSHWTFINDIELLILSGIGVIVPLSLYSTAQFRRDGKLPRPVQIAINFHFVAIVSTGVSLLLPQGTLAGLLAMGWFIQAALVFVVGLNRWLPRPNTGIEDLCIDMGFLYVVISGIWWVAYRGSGAFLEFTGVLVPLTAAHFVFIGLGALVIAGKIGQYLPTRTNLFRVAAWGAVISPAVVAIGIFQTQLLKTISIIEVLGAILLGGSYLLLAGLFLVRVRPTISHPWAKWLMTVSTATLFLTMALALGYASGRITHGWWITIPDMVRWHGWFNAVGFVGLGLLGWSLLPTRPQNNAPGIPFSMFSGKWYIGADYFSRIGAIDNKKKPPSGIVDNLLDYTTPNCAIGQLSPHIRAFYEQTAEHHLHVYPEWTRFFRLPSTVYKWLSRRVQQMNLPLVPEPDTSLISSVISPLNDTMDGRENVRGWVRTYTHTHEVVYVAAYSSHSHANVLYMNIAFPLPGGNLTSILRLRTCREDNQLILSLTSLNSANEAGDQGVYFVNRFLPLRLPINETIEVFPTQHPDFPKDAFTPSNDCIFARHRMWLFGLRFLTLHYTIWRDKTP